MTNPALQVLVVHKSLFFYKATLKLSGNYLYCYGRSGKRERLIVVSVFQFAPEMKFSLASPLLHEQTSCERICGFNANLSVGAFQSRFLLAFHF